MKELVFVYGTLKKGKPNHHILDNAWTDYVGKATTVGHYRMWCIGFPLIMSVPADYDIFTAPVVGEVYAVDEQVMARLDRLENNGRMYRRQQIAVMMKGSKEHQAWCYHWLLHPQGQVIARDTQGLLNWKPVREVRHRSRPLQPVATQNAGA